MPHDTEHEDRLSWWANPNLSWQEFHEEAMKRARAMSAKDQTSYAMRRKQPIAERAAILKDED